MNTTPKETTELATLLPERGGEVAPNAYDHMREQYESIFKGPGSMASWKRKQTITGDIADEYVEMRVQFGWMAFQAGHRIGSRTAPSIPAQPGSGEAAWPDILRAITEAHDDAMRHAIDARIPECGHFGGIAQNLSWALDQLPVRATPAPADSAPMQPEESAALAKQVSTWRKEVTRLQDLIGTATGQADSARPATWQDRMTAHYAKGSVQCHGSEHFMALELAEWRGADSAAERDARLTMQGMADCMDMVRGELIEAGIIDKTVPPMMISNAVFAKIGATERDAARWRFMMRVAEHPEGPEAQAMEAFGNEMSEDGNEGAQMGALVDAAMESIAAMQPKGK